jgi:mannonate dehydratase
MPVAEEAGVRIGLHPDDPPTPSLGGVARVFRSASAYQRAIEIAASENFGLCFCVGTWAEGGDQLGKNVYEMIRFFGPQGRIFKVHFRNVSAPLPQFQETLVDAGYIDMEKVARLLQESGFNGVMIPDHVPGEGLTGNNTAYTIGYMRAAVQQARTSASRS